VNTIDHRRRFRFKRLRRRNVGRDHEIFHHAVGIKPLTHSDLSDLPLLIEHNPALRQFELKRIARLAR